MIRSHDADYINHLANHPDIRPYIGGDGASELDLSQVLANPDNVFLTGEAGGFIATWTAPETYEIHTLILPEGRGAQAYMLGRAGIKWMAKRGATHLWTRVDRKHRHTRIFALKAGFKAAGEQSLDLGAGPVLYDLFSWRPTCQQ